MTTATTENRKQDARSEGEPAQTSDPPGIRSAQHTSTKEPEGNSSRKKRGMGGGPLLRLPRVSGTYCRDLLRTRRSIASATEEAG